MSILIFSPFANFGNQSISYCISYYPKKQITKNDCMFYAVPPS
jgi:hypothetical protein